MPLPRVVALVALAILSRLALAPYSYAQETATSTQQLFVPPLLGAPGDRLGASTRDAQLPTGQGVLILAPPGGGYTARAAPTVAWEVASEAAHGLLIVRLMDYETKQGLASVTISNPATGVGWVDLGVTGLSLELNRPALLEVSLLGENQEVVGRATSLVERTVAEGQELPVDQDLDQSQMAAVCGAGLWWDCLRIALWHNSLDLLQPGG